MLRLLRELYGFTNPRSYNRTLQKKLTETEGNIVAAKLDLTETCAALDKGAEELTLLEAHRDDLLKQNGVYTSELATLQDAMADRSTISDARERDVALFRQEEEVKALQAQLATLSAERAEDGSVASFETAQLQIAKTELEARVLELSNEVSVLQKQLSALRVDSTPVDTDTEVDRLLIAIERLRKERDELRQSLNFANHDKDFALKASSAHKISALNELDLVKERLQVAVDAQKTLTEELEVRSTRVTELETARAESVGGYAALASEKEQLAVELQQVRTALREAESLVSSLSASAEGLNTEVADAQRRCNEAEELAKQRLTELEEARATAGEDVRQLLAERVQASSKPADTAARQLKQDLDEQLQRVIRRDGESYFLNVHRLTAVSANCFAPS
jgi:chromosome segregation ATPase